MASRSGAAQIIPSQPAFKAFSQREIIVSSFFIESLVKTVTPKTPGFGRPTLSAPSLKPSTAALSISSPPAACTVTHRAPTEPTTRAAL